MGNLFNLRRLFLLLRNEVLSDYKSWLIYLITIIGIYTGISLIEGLHYKFSGELPNLNNLNYLFPGFLFLGGFIATSMVFEDANDKFKSSLYFSLPGSSLEKYSVGLLVSGIGYVVFIILAFILASVVSNIFTRPIFGFGLDLFNPFTLAMGPFGNSIWLLCLLYLLTHSMFLVGSIAFRKAAFIKTVLVAFAIQLSYSIIFSIIGFFITRSGIILSWDLSFFAMFFRSLMMQPSKSMVLITIIVIGLILSIFFNTVGYFKLKEKEVKGGV